MHKASIVDDEEDEWDEKAVKGNKITKRERSSSDGDDLADSDEEEEEDDLDDSDDEPVTKRKRLGKVNKTEAQSKKPDVSRPPLAPVRNYNTPAQGVATPKASSQSSSQSTKSCLFDQCSAQSSGGGNSNNTTPYNGKALSFQSDTPTSAVTMPVLPEGVHGPGSHGHNKLDFLLPGKKRDRNNNRPDHPQYNPRTCLIPASFLKEQTPAMLQWWIIKQDNMDTVLFFKVFLDI